MDENMKENGHHWGCMCGMCKGGMGMGGMHGWGHHHSPWHVIIKIVVIVFVFWLGTQVGELHAYRGGMMGGYGTYYNRHMPMMGGYDGGGNYYYGPTGPSSATSSQGW